MMPEVYSPTDLTALILAGGQSSRLGRDKALIAIQGRPLLQHLCLLVQECASFVYVVAPWVERYEPILPDRCQMIREVLPPGAAQPQGPLIGFAQALAYVQTEWVLLLACDLPKLTLAEMHSWLSYLAATPETAIALLPRHEKGWEPLCGFYRRRCLPHLDAFVRQGGRSFQEWLAQSQVQELPVSDRQLLFNCNTPADLAQISI
jgi:molybdopterin-guanine dinucleotide biosynthesis protein A